MILCDFEGEVINNITACDLPSLGSLVLGKCYHVTRTLKQSYRGPCSKELRLLDINLPVI